MQAPGNGVTLDPTNCGVEQDIMESFTPGEIITHAYHMKGYGADYRGFNAYRMPGSVDCMKNPVWKLDTEEFHTFGLLWEEDGYTVFIDGRQSGEKVGCGKGEAVSQVPEFILISTECKMFRTNRGTGKQDPDLEAAFQAGDDFVVDYVRVFDRVDKPTPEAPDRKWANFHARDLAPVKGEKRVGGDITVVHEGKAMPIVYNAKSKNQRNGPAANFLADVIFEMTGVRPDVFAEYPDRTVDVSPAFYVGDDVSAFKRHEALVKAGLAEPLPTASVEDEEFVVVPRKGSYWFLGRGDHGVFDFCDRILGVRQYFLENDIGRFAPKTRGLRVPQIEWRDKPVFAMRSNYPWWASQWGRYLRDSGGGPVSRYPNLHVHPAGNLNRETNFNFGVRSPDIFEINADGKRNAQLCWGNPKALEAYKEIVTAGIEKGTPTYGIVDRWAKTVTVSQLDQGVHCHCERCQRLYDHSKAPNGDASPCIWGYFVKNLSEWMADKYPDWHIVILPYHNTCGCPEGLTFPRGNVTAMLCTMPGLALMKNAACKKHEEDLMRQWAKCTGNRVLNWHYSIWPSEFTAAPYVFGETIKSHYKDMETQLSGSFLNGWYDVPRLSLSVYVWMRCLWNPNIDVQAVYDGFATRMFGKAAAPMRKLIDMQEKGWNRQWDSDVCSVKNVYQISYPRADVLKMQALLDEAEKLTAGDVKATARIAWYRSGFRQFFKESEENASGKAFVPQTVKKAQRAPKVDGKLDDACWELAEPSSWVSAMCKTNPTPRYGTVSRAVWYPGEGGGVTFGFRFEEPATTLIREGVQGDVWGQDNFEIFIDASGSGDGHYYQILVDGSCRIGSNTDGIPWKPDGVKAAKFVGEGWWSAEVFVPFAALKKFPKAQIPTTAANGVTWTGNLCRYRYGDCVLPKEKRAPGSRMEMSRLWTRHNSWNKDPAAFGTFKFVE